MNKKILKLAIGIASGVSRGRHWDTSISPQERKRRHEAAQRERKQREAKYAAELAAMLKKNQRRERKDAEARANRTLEQQAIVDEELRRLQAMAQKPASGAPSRPTIDVAAIYRARNHDGWARAFASHHPFGGKRS